MIHFPPLLPARSRHLAERFSYGVTPALAADIRSFDSVEGWFNAQLARSKPENLRATLVPTWFPLLNNIPGLALQLSSSGLRSGWTVGNELIARTFARRVLSEHQVYETMVDFWSNLLYVPAGEARSFAWRASYDDTIRRYAFTSYRELLRASIIHPAMARYLTNDLNYKDGINENLGREVLELHTVGRSAYDEDDVINSARMLTGWTTSNLTLFSASYDSKRHWTGPIKVLGFKHPNQDADGRAALNAMLDYLALHPATAERVARRLCVRFVADEPSEAIVQAVAKAYLRSKSDVKTTLRALIRHPQFRGASAQKSRTPSDDVVHTARVLGLKPAGALNTSAFVYQLVNRAGDMGQVTFRWPAPDGWAEETQGYLSASRVLRSWQVHLSLAGTKGTMLIDVDIASKPSQLPASWPRTLAELVDHQSQRIVGRRASRELIDAVAAATGLRPKTSFASADALSDWQYQLLRGTVLNSPAGLMR